MLSSETRRNEGTAIVKTTQDKIVYSEETDNSVEYTNKLDEGYSRFAGLYDIAVKLLPVWKTWIKSIIPHIDPAAREE